MKAVRFAILIITLTFSLSEIKAQTVLGLQNYDAGTPVMTVTTTGTGTTFTGNSAAGDRPATASFFKSSTTAFGVSNGTAIATYANFSGLTAYTSKFYEFNLAAFSIASTGNGMDPADIVTVEVSIDGGAFSNELTVNGPAANNAFWHYSTGTGTATITYDGNNTPTAFTPAGGGNRTTDGYSLIHVNLPNSCASAQIRITLLNNASGERWVIDDVKLVGTLTTPCVVAAAPTTNATNAIPSPGCTSSIIDFTAGNGGKRIVVMSTSPISGTPTNATNYGASTTFGAGSTIGASQFVVFNGNGNQASIVGLTSGTTYFYAIFEYNGTGTNCDESYLTSTPLTGSFTTLTVCGTPQVRAILADACGPSEGTDELVILQNGASPLALSDMSFGFPSGGTFCNGSCGVNTLGNNATYVNALNTQAGCTLFFFSDPVPAGAVIVVFTGNPPSTTFDYSALCPSATQYYVVFCNNNSTTGRFANSGAGTRTLSCVFAGVNENVTYSPGSLPGDGSFVYFDDPGNPTYALTTNCTYPLGVELVQFAGARNEKEVDLSWMTLTEIGTDRFDIERIDPLTLASTVIGTVSAAGNSDIELNYSFTDTRPLNGINYYRLNQYDRDGKNQLSNIIAVNMELNEQIISYKEGNLFFTQTLLTGTQFEITASNGQNIQSGELTENTLTIPQELATGMWFIKLTERNGKQEVYRCMVVNE